MGEGESVARQLLLLRSDSYPDIVEVDKVGYVDNTELEFKVWGDRELFQIPLARTGSYSKLASLVVGKNRGVASQVFWSLVIGEIKTIKKEG